MIEYIAANINPTIKLIVEDLCFSRAYFTTFTVVTAPIKTPIPNNIIAKRYSKLKVIIIFNAFITGIYSFKITRTDDPDIPGRIIVDIANIPARRSRIPVAKEMLVNTVLLFVEEAEKVEINITKKKPIKKNTIYFIMGFTFFSKIDFSSITIRGIELIVRPIKKELIK